MMLAQGKRLHAKVVVSHNIVTWLVEHVFNKFAVGADGRTAYEGIKGTKYHERLSSAET